MEKFLEKKRLFKENHKVKYFFRELWYDCTCRLWYKITNAKDEVKWAWQRVFRGYDDTAYWGLYSYLTDIALPVLKWYKTNAHGIPSMVCIEKEPMELSQKRWNNILDKMIFSFEIIKKDENLIEPKEVQVRVDEGLVLFAKYFQCLWD